MRGLEIAGYVLKEEGKNAAGLSQRPDGACHRNCQLGSLLDAKIVDGMNGGER